MATNQRELCRYFLSGACRFGPNCFNSHDRNDTVSNVCRYYLQGTCLYGNKCRYEHAKPKASKPSSSTSTKTIAAISRPATNTDLSTFSDASNEDQCTESPKSYKDAVKRNQSEDVDADACNVEPNDDLSSQPLCPYFEKAGECLFNFECGYLHGELCEICNTNCLHPFDKDQQDAHRIECMKRVEDEMNEAFQVKHSQDKQCGICMEVVWDKENHSDRRFGILINCNHIFCLPCIRKWRSSKAYENKIVKACPECRVKSEFVTPSLYWFEDENDKMKIIEEYKNKLKATNCKYFKSGDGTCPFGNKCFYLHRYPDGTIADLPSPSQRRRLNRNGFLESFSDLVRLDFNYFQDDDDDDEDFVDAEDYFNIELLELFGNNILHRLQESDSEYSDLSLLEMFDDYFIGH